MVGSACSGGPAIVAGVERLCAGTGDAPMKRVILAMMMLVAVTAAVSGGCKAAVDDDGAELKVGDN